MQEGVEQIEETRRLGRMCGRWLVEEKPRLAASRLQ